MKNAVFAATIALVMSLPVQSQPYRVTHSHVLGGEGSWDYVVPGPPGHRLFVARQNRVMVIDQDTGTLLAPAGGRGRGPVLPGSFTLMVIERDPAAR